MSSRKLQVGILVCVVSGFINATFAVPCVVPEGPPGTVTLPPIGCEYVSPDEVHEIIDGLPPGTTIELDPIHWEFMCDSNPLPICSVPPPAGECETPGGSLGGHADCFESWLDLDVTGTGLLTGFTRHLSVPIACDIHTGPRNPGDPVQTFATNMYRLQGELFGDPDFCTFRVYAGTDFGLPSPGQTTLTDLGGGLYNVDSFFDITYQIDFEGCPGSPLDGYMGTTTATIRMQTEPFQECVPLPDGTGCTDVACPIAGDICQPKCTNYDPDTGQTIIIDCECGTSTDCHAEVPPSSDACIVPDNGTGTVTLPPIGCDYISPDEVHQIIDGLPPGTTIELAPIHMDFICNNPIAACSGFIPAGECEALGGSLGGHFDCFESTLDLDVNGTGMLAGFTRHLAVPMFCEVHTGLRNPGDPVQTFPNEMYRLQGQLFGDPDFCEFIVIGGIDYGLPSPGETTLTDLGGGLYNVDSFFDITYQIQFVGCPGSVLNGLGGTTTATIRMETKTAQPPVCVGGCDVGETCEQTEVTNPDGTIDICCNCVPEVCEPLPDGSGCTDMSCPEAGDVCQSTCMNFEPLTGETDIIDCDCGNPTQCHAEAPPEQDPCIVPDNGTGTVTLPPIGCDYISPDEVHQIIDGLPPGTTIELDPIHMDFICTGAVSPVCSMPLLPGTCEMLGGSLGGHADCFESTLDLTVRGTGSLEGFNRHLAVPIACEVHTALRNPGDPVQTFDTVMYRMQGELFGDPDFCTLRITGGTDYGLPSPGETTLTDIGGGLYHVDSFFDITYQIEFEGCPASPLQDYMGTTTATIRMETKSAQPPTCVGGCDAGEKCEETQTVNPDGTIDVCCNCVPDVCEPTPDGTACNPPETCPLTTEDCLSRCINFDPFTGANSIAECACRPFGDCHAVPPPPADPCFVADNGTGTATLPPIGCDYISPDEVHEIIDGLPPGTTIELDPIHMDFICTGIQNPICSLALAPGTCEMLGGSLGGHGDCFESTLDLTVTGTGSLEGFNRHLAVPISCEVHTGLRNPGDPVQTFATDMYRMQGELFGDPDFCTLRIIGGTDYGLPSPGETTMTDVGGGLYHIDSFFDITYQIEFEGCPASVIQDYMGTTTATIRMRTEMAEPPTCDGGCPIGYVCGQSTTDQPDGTVDYCCDCVPAPCGPTPDGSQCQPIVCPDPTQECQARCLHVDPGSDVTTVTDCECRDPGACHAEPPPAGNDNPCQPPDNGSGTVTLPPQGCEYLSPQEVHKIIDGLPPGTTIELDPIHSDFFNVQTSPGGSLGGEIEQFESALYLDVSGTGSLAGFNRYLAVPVYCEVHTGPRDPGDPVQSFANDMFRLQGELFGDPDFCTLRVIGGTDNGLPGPGQTTLTDLGDGTFHVDSFFDITYQIEFEGCPASPLEDYMGTTTATIRMETGDPLPSCLGDCPEGYACHQTVTGNGDGTYDACCDCVEDVCELTPETLRCTGLGCSVAGETCQERCLNYDPATGQSAVAECDCRDLALCHIEEMPPPVDPCVVADNGTGTATLPPIGCDYLSPTEVHEIIDGLPPGTTIELEPIHMDFSCTGIQNPICSLALAPGVCETLGGSLGGHGDCFESTLDLDVRGTGSLEGFNRHLAVPIYNEVHTGPRNPGDPIQTFDTVMYRLQGELFGDPDFCTLRITGGTDYGLPSPGETTLRDRGDGTYMVDSFFDITYQIEFEGCPASVIQDYMGTTTATIRMRTEVPDPPTCVSGCPLGFVCERTEVPQPDGTVDVCCDCVMAPCEPTPDGSQCQPIECPDPTQECQPQCLLTDTAGQTTISDCECRDPGACHVEPPPAGPDNPCFPPDNGLGTVTLPPEGCEYLSPQEVHMIIDGLPPGTTIELDPIHMDFINVETTPGGSLGGEIESFDSTLDLTVSGTGELAGFNRHLAVPISCAVHTGPRNPGDPVQSFANDMFQLQGELFGDPDFCTLRVLGGTDFGLPGPGQTTLTDLGDGTFHVDSFFDITYQIEFEGCPASQIQDYAGTTTATIRMETGTDLPTCTGACPDGYVCHQTVTGHGDGTYDTCCDCREFHGACCLMDHTCVETTYTDCVVNLGGVFQGDGSVCLGMQACCLLDSPATCVDADALCCAGIGGVPQGPGTSCGATEACCVDGGCLDIDPQCCLELGGVPQGSGTGCSIISVACCWLAGMECEETDPLCCDEINGVPSPIGSEVCLGDGNGDGIDDACVGMGDGACCFGFTGGGCVETTEQDCIVNFWGFYQGDGTTCGGFEACCMSNGTCDDIGIDATCCINEFNGTPQGPGSECSIPETCCQPSGSCQEIDPLCCDDIGGTESPIGEPVCLGDGNGNGVDDACEPPTVPPDPEPGGPPCVTPADCTGVYLGADCVAGICYVPKNRYVSIDPTTNVDPVAYQVEIVEASAKECTGTAVRCVSDLECAPGQTCDPLYSQAALGRAWWMGDPVCYDYPNGQPVPGAITCEGPDYFGWVSILRPRCDGGSSDRRPCELLPVCMGGMVPGFPCGTDLDCPSYFECQTSTGVWTGVACTPPGPECGVGEVCNLKSPGFCLSCPGGTCVADMPVPRLWTEVPVHVTGCPVAPVITYAIRASTDGMSFSDPLVINTIHVPTIPQNWGDLTGGPEPGQPPWTGLWLPPDRSASMADVQAAIRTFQNQAEETGFPSRVWVETETNQVVNMGDIQFLVMAFEGREYASIGLPLIGLDPALCPPSMGRLGGYGNSGCLRDTRSDGAKGRTAWCDEDVVEFTVEPGTLHMLHHNAEYNCCPDDILVSLSIEGRSIRLWETEILTMPCDCMCCYDVEATVVDLAPGPYTVELCWLDTDPPGERCYQAEVIIP